MNFKKIKTEDSDEFECLEKQQQAKWEYILNKFRDWNLDSHQF